MEEETQRNTRQPTEGVGEDGPGSRYDIEIENIEDMGKLFSLLSWSMCLLLLLRGLKKRAV